MTIFTIGHSTRPIEVFTNILKEAGIKTVADVRTIPRSRHNPQFNKETFPIELAPADIGYIHLPGLGGLRRSKPDSPNTGWRNASFQGFADYMLTEKFEEHLKGLIATAQEGRLVIMCAETLPWRCHRSLIADALLVRGIEVLHIMGQDDYLTHKITPWAKVEGLRTTYPPETP